jgi:two-component sensor histidine kinase
MIITIFFFLPLFAFAFEKNSYRLPLCEIYIDYNNTTTIHTVETKTFAPFSAKEQSFGYSPPYTVWLRFSLTNPSKYFAYRTVEYVNPLTTHIALYDAASKKLIKQEGLFFTDRNDTTLNPAFYITLEPGRTRTFYLQASSYIAPLIVGLRVWNTKAFNTKEHQNQLFLGLFFGAMGMIILYNLIIYFAVKEKVYLYYVLAFIGILFHHLMYKGIASNYLFDAEQMKTLMHYSAFIVAFPTFFLALFTKDILSLHQYARINKILNGYLVLFPILIAISFVWELNMLRSLFSVILLLLLIISSLYALWYGNPQAKFIVAGWFLFFTSGLFMYLSSAGIYDIFSKFPYYVEVSLIAEALLFSFLLSHKIKHLNEEKIAAQNRYISYKEKEQQRLASLVEQKTSQLTKALLQQQTLLQELNHRVKNSMQSIVSFIRLQKDKLHTKSHIDLLDSVENRVLAVNNLYALLHTNDNVTSVYAYEYFSMIIDDIEACFQNENIRITLNTSIIIPSDLAVYCGFIINEALTNSFKHAFNHNANGHIHIVFENSNGIYNLTIKDDGSDCDDKHTTSGVGMFIIKKLATEQLGGNISVNTQEGCTIHIEWSEHAT